MREVLSAQSRRKVYVKAALSMALLVNPVVADVARQSCPHIPSGGGETWQPRKRTSVRL